MNLLWAEVFVDLDNAEQVGTALARLIVAGVLGAVIGWERQIEGKATSARMHIILALGTALVTFIAYESSREHASRVLQGILSGIGFLGAGTIMKQSEEGHVYGLTTATTVWLTAAIGMTVGAGYLWPALLCTALGWVVLTSLPRHSFTLGK